MFTIEKRVEYIKNSNIKDDLKSAFITELKRLEYESRERAKLVEQYFTSRGFGRNIEGDETDENYLRISAMSNDGSKVIRATMYWDDFNYAMTFDLETQKKFLENALVQAFQQLEDNNVNNYKRNR